MGSGPPRQMAGAPYDGAVLVKWIRCTVVDRRGFERGQRKWAGLLGEPGFRGQGGGWSRQRADVAHVFGFWESRAFYDSFMARSHDRLAAAQSGTYKNIQVKLFDHRFDVKTGFEPRFTDADVVRVAHCTVHADRAEHYTLMQQKVWNPAMAGSPGMVRGCSATPQETSFWSSPCGARRPSTASTRPTGWSGFRCAPRRMPTSRPSPGTSWNWNRPGRSERVTTRACTSIDRCDPRDLRRAVRTGARTRPAI